MRRAFHLAAPVAVLLAVCALSPPADAALPPGTNNVAGAVFLVGTPQPGIRVDLMKNGGVIETTMTGPNGQFAFPPIDRGDYELLASGVIKDKIRSSLPMPVHVEAAPATATNVRVEIIP